MGKENLTAEARRDVESNPTLRKNGEGWGTRPLIHADER
jgi:hypothetical protein